MPAADAPYDLAVIGGGPAGVATVLAAKALERRWRVLWCRGPEEAARGFLPAYGGNSLCHRLNVPVERMGLDAEAPVDFFDWLRREHPERRVEPGQFVPRRWFGEYLGTRSAGCNVDTRSGPVRGLCRERDDWRIDLASDACEGHPVPSLARRVVLCLGMPAGLSMPGAPRHWVSDPWGWWRALRPEDVPLGDGGSVLVVGSGLTAVDMVLGLRERGFRGHIRVVSPVGRWSEPHAPAPALDPESRERLDDALDSAAGARDLLRVIRSMCAHHPWRAVVDALRADTNARWAALPMAEQRRLLRHLFDQWNRHRHRMAPDVRAALDADPALVIEPGRVHVDAHGGVWKRHRGVETSIDAGLVLDCRGPGFRAALSGDSLLARLVREGVLEAHPLGTGVRSPADPSLAVVGAARFGERFETTAVPELRQQAVEVVRRWLDQPSLSHSRGTR